MTQFKIGDIVTWTSQSQGYEKCKQGEIVVIIPPDKGMFSYIHHHFNIKDLRPIFNLNNILSGGTRNHESYIIAVPGKTDKAKKVLYWPVVSRLNKVK